MKTIFVVYTNIKLSNEEIRKRKKYSFNTSSDVAVGDMIKTAKYDTNLQVTDVLDEAFKYYNSSTGEMSNVLKASSQYEILELQIREDEQEIVYGSIIKEA